MYTSGLPISCLCKPGDALSLYRSFEWRRNLCIEWEVLHNVTCGKGKNKDAVSSKPCKEAKGFPTLIRRPAASCCYPKEISMPSHVITNQ